MLATHEVLYQKSLRALRKKLSALHNSTVAPASRKTSNNRKQQEVYNPHILPEGLPEDPPQRLVLCLPGPPPPASCPRPELPAHSRRLGRVFNVGHEVHFLCNPGYELIGPRTRVCLESSKWSGQKPMCRRESRLTLDPVLVLP